MIGLWHIPVRGRYCSKAYVIHIWFCTRKYISCTSPPGRMSIFLRVFLFYFCRRFCRRELALAACHLSSCIMHRPYVAAKEVQLPLNNSLDNTDVKVDLTISPCIRIYMTSRNSGGVVDGPLAECSLTVADRGDLNVHLSCRIRCKPPLTALFWIIDDRGTTVSDGQIVGEYWVLVQVSRTCRGCNACQ